MRNLISISAILIILFNSVEISEAQSDLVQYGKMVSTNRTHWEYFGKDVDMSKNFMSIGDFKDEYVENGENRLVQAGAAYLYRFDPGGNFEYVTQLLDPYRQAWEFGSSVSVMDNFALIDCPKYNLFCKGVEYIATGLVHFFKRFQDNSWSVINSIQSTNKIS